METKRLRKASHISPKDRKTASKADLVHEVPGIIIDESFLLEHFESNVGGSQQVRACQSLGFGKGEKKRQTNSKGFLLILLVMWRSSILGQEQGIQN